MSEKSKYCNETRDNSSLKLSKSKLDFDPTKPQYIVKRIKKFRFKKSALEYLKRFEKEEPIPIDVKIMLEDFIDRIYKDMRVCEYSPRVLLYYINSVESGEKLMAKIRINFFNEFGKQIKSGPKSPLYKARIVCTHFGLLFSDENEKYRYIFKEALRNEIMLSERSNRYKDL